MSRANQNFQKVIAILKYLDLNLEDPKKPVNFQSRLVIQKIVFLSQLMDIDLGGYNFSLYRNGPYSSQLTADYYTHNYLVTSLETNIQLNQKEKMIIDKINDLVLKHPLTDFHQADFLEAISTAYHFKFYDEKLLDDELFVKTKNEKPYISDKVIVIAINQLKKLLYSAEYLTKEIRKELELWDNIDD